MKHLPPKEASTFECEEAPAASSLCLQTWMERDYAKLWRVLRALGVLEYDLEDAVQEVFWIAFQKRDSIVLGSEWAYLAGVARGYASNYRKKPSFFSHPPSSWEEFEGVASSDSDPEKACQEMQEEACIHKAISRLPDDLRDLFVLLAIEEMSQYEVADLLELPRTTVASKWKKAREMFEHEAKELLNRGKTLAQGNGVQLETPSVLVSERLVKGGAHE